MKKVKGKARLIMYAGVSKASPKLGQALGPLGMNMAGFCKEFNEKTNHFRPDVPMRVLLTAYTDRTYIYKIKPPNTSWFIKRLGGSEFGSPFGKARIIGPISLKYIYELAKLKQEFDEDLKTHPVSSICKSIIVQAEGMGFHVAIDTDIPKNVIPFKF